MTSAVRPSSGSWVRRALPPGPFWNAFASTSSRRLCRSGWP